MRDLLNENDKTVFLTQPQAPAPEKPIAALQSPSHRFGGLSRKMINEPAASIKPLTLREDEQNILAALQLNYRSGINPVIEHATELFFAHYQMLKGRFNQADKIRVFIQDALLKFEVRCQQAGLAKTMVKSAKYVLCTFLDEAVLQKDWGRDSNWSQQSLLAQYFNETWGGATVFKIRQFCTENIHEYIDLLEMIYICLCLGFKGQYGAELQAETVLTRIKRETYQTITDYRGDKLNLPLSPQGISNYQGKSREKKTNSFKWLVVSCVSVLIIAYISMSAFISLESRPVYNKVMQISEN